MDKQQLLEFIQSLPENLQVMPISLTDSSSRKVGDTEFVGLGGSTYRAEYEECYENDLTLTFHFKTKIRFEFQRDERGFPQTANSRRIS